MNVSLFITCLTDNFYPRVGQAVVAVLEHLGCKIDFPEEQTCCGQPMFNTGSHDDARELAKRMVHIFEHSDYVVTPSGSCCAMIHDYYPTLFESDPTYQKAGMELVSKSYEFADFLLKVLKVDLGQLGCEWPGKVTYHYSCHLRGLHMTSEAVLLLKQIKGLEYAELGKKEQCCGFGGTFAVKYPQISGTMVRDKVTEIAKTGAQTVCSNDGGCTLNISGSCHREGLDVGFKHLAEIIAEGLGLLPREDAIESGEAQTVAV